MHPVNQTEPVPIIKRQIWKIVLQSGEASSQLEVEDRLVGYFDGWQSDVYKRSASSRLKSLWNSFIVCFIFVQSEISQLHNLRRIFFFCDLQQNKMQCILYFDMGWTTAWNPRKLIYTSNFERNENDKSIL